MNTLLAIFWGKSILINLLWIALYILAIIVSIKIILENRNPQKTVSYLLLIIFLPFIGIPVYYFFGVNIRSRRKYNIKKLKDSAFFDKMKQAVTTQSEKIIQDKKLFLENQSELVKLLLKDSLAQITTDNKINLLINGESKFPEVIKAIENAKYHIHIEYYIFEDDEIGNVIKNLLIRKSREGVKIRFIYDDFGSRSIRKSFAADLQDAGIEIHPFYKTYFSGLANRWNYRNHRKIVVIDGCIGFTGGINVADHYVNKNDNNKLYWRDTHLKIEGSAVHTLQLIFISDWNFTAKNKLDLSFSFFPVQENDHHQVVQIASSGPDSERATIMLAFFTAIVCATKRVFITTPYFIPNESILTALKQAALSGIDVRLLVPRKGDSRLVNAATQSFVSELLDAGVRIFMYTKGFVHSKTMIIDDNLAIVGTANMDMRSFDMNFEVNAFIYDQEVNQQLENVFMEDLKYSREASLNVWNKRSNWRVLAESLVRLFAPVL
ncbi:MAG: cardiolipin synthase [Bacteroidia bacterium]